MIKPTLTSLLLLALAGCTHSQSHDNTGNTMPGSDRDKHGCIGSAGYSWCESKNECVRSWELADDQGFDNTQAAFDAFCNNKK
ncbi:hypothetical protein [Veronia pacifica]|uniref:Lipoprotein n=1 Tax=Veronia pacifica TaxID=1080227 RepID=A0A1C3EPE2_9GAMM|nr:hypothetical protein [Veronia pacifica]ODA35069.1 hypothetical protein A8L45_05160 [Veronia pacifica]